MCVCVCVCAVPFHFIPFFPPNTYKQCTEHRGVVRFGGTDKAQKTKNLFNLNRLFACHRCASLFYVPRSFCFLIITIERVHLQYLCNPSNAIMHYDRTTTTMTAVAAAATMPSTNAFFVKHIYSLHEMEL